MGREWSGPLVDTKFQLCCDLLTPSPFQTEKLDASWFAFPIFERYDSFHKQGVEVRFQKRPAFWSR